MPICLGDFIKKTAKDVMDYGVHIKHLTQVFIILSQVNGRIWNSEMEPGHFTQAYDFPVAARNSTNRILESASWTN